MTAEAREIETTILRALAERGQGATADAVGISETRLSRWKNHADNGGGLDLEEASRVIAMLGLRLVPASVDGAITVPTDAWRALHILVRDYADGVARKM